MANGLDEKRVMAFAERVRRIDQDGLGIRVFSGIECDIRKDGSMDLADDALAALDLVVGSVHSYMNLEPAAMTDRLLRALECPHLRVLGHPTGRLLLQRDSFPFDFERVAARSRPARRLSRDQRQPRAAGPGRHRCCARPRSEGAKFIISTDAHHPKHLAEHALRGADGAPRLAGGRRRAEHASAG